MSCWSLLHFTLFIFMRCPNWPYLTYTYHTFFLCTSTCAFCFVAAMIGECCQTVVIFAPLVEFVSVPGDFAEFHLAWDAIIAALPSPLSCDWSSTSALFDPFTPNPIFSGILTCASYQDMAIPLLLRVCEMRPVWASHLDMVHVFYISNFYS